MFMVVIVQNISYRLKIPMGNTIFGTREKNKRYRLQRFIFLYEEEFVIKICHIAAVKRQCNHCSLVFEIILLQGNTVSIRVSLTLFS